MKFFTKEFINATRGNNVLEDLELLEANELVDDTMLGVIIEYTTNKVLYVSDSAISIKSCLYADKIVKDIELDFDRIILSV